MIALKIDKVKSVPEVRRLDKLGVDFGASGKLA